MRRSAFDGRTNFPSFSRLLDVACGHRWPVTRPAEDGHSASDSGKTCARRATACRRQRIHRHWLGGLQGADVPAKKKAPPKQSQNTSRTSAQKLISPKNLQPGAGTGGPTDSIPRAFCSAPAQLGGQGQGCCLALRITQDGIFCVRYLTQSGHGYHNLFGLEGFPRLRQAGGGPTASYAV
jgi:hypothetical protein